eukprot:TRINITY_DN11194_c0_g1_i1.p1 TRINITY_DN11194_c0_g1~~TRINITY_DN11194_c0_g1_i1.p1  ORF type:complete len:129 (-),score=1.54 TRINITY_DN11194_c0_g1_i1:8-394(-)
MNFYEEEEIELVSQGWMNKRGGNFKNWKKRYFRLYSCGLLIYTKEKYSKTKGSIYLYSCTLNSTDEGRDESKFYFTIESKKFSRIFLFEVETQEKRDTWIQNLEIVVDKTPSKMSKSALRLNVLMMNS